MSDLNFSNRNPTKNLYCAKFSFVWSTPVPYFLRQFLCSKCPACENPKLVWLKLSYWVMLNFRCSKMLESFFQVLHPIERVSNSLLKLGKFGSNIGRFLLSIRRSRILLNSNSAPSTASVIFDHFNLHDWPRKVNLVPKAGHEWFADSIKTSSILKIYFWLILWFNISPEAGRWFQSILLQSTWNGVTLCIGRSLMILWSTKSVSMSISRWFSFFSVIVRKKLSLLLKSN